ncbi:MAG: glucosaminidase domain-containing protein [Alphaproteobacteria bacterium]
MSLSLAPESNSALPKESRRNRKHKLQRDLYRRLATPSSTISAISPGYWTCVSLAIILLVSLLAQNILRQEARSNNAGIQYSASPLSALSTTTTTPSTFFYRGTSLADLDYLGPPPPDLETIERQLAQIGYDWDALQSGIEVPRHFVQKLPPNFASATGNQRKQLFVRLVLPLILEVNEETIESRSRLLALNPHATLSEEDSAWLANLAEQYRVKDQPLHQKINQLKVRVNVIPVDIALAQAAVESGWGSSRFARQGNALFGQRGGTSGRYLIASRATNVRVQAFHSLADSVRSYFDNLNGHPSYAKFRNRRNQRVESGEPLTATSLLPTLENYAAAEGYAKKLAIIINSNGFSALHNLHLEPKPKNEDPTLALTR